MNSHATALAAVLVVGAFAAMAGIVSNVTVSGQPLTATTTANAGGKLNDISRRGAE